MTTSTKATGTIGELAVSQILLRAGWDVFRDLTDSCHFDLIAHKQGRFIRIQVKTVSDVSNGTFGLALHNANGTYDHNNVDVIAAYVVERNIVAFADLKALLEQGYKGRVTIRVDPAKINVEGRANSLEDFSFENCLIFH